MLNKIIIFILLTTTYSFSQVVTLTKIQKAQGVGIASSRSKAINEAIVEAVGQIAGVQIKKKTLIKNLQVEDDKGGKLTLNYSAKIDKLTSGKADSFKILSVDKIPNGMYKATVLVTNKKVTKEYKTPGYNKNKRRSIVVVPANFNSGMFNIMGKKISSIETNINLSQELLNSITQTRKFNVLDRQESKAFYNEQNIFKSQNAQKDEVLKLGQVLGADYLLLTSIKDLNITQKAANKYIVNANTSYETSITVQFKVITTATRQVKFANTKTYIFKPEGETNKEIYYNTLAHISNKITTQIIENIYPIKIVDTKGGDIILNQGNLNVGTTYKVYKLGNQIIDSYTKESLGKKEIKIGVIKITRTLPKYSVASIVEGKALKGCIIRSLYNSKKKNNHMTYENGLKSNAKIKDNGGVILPFD